MLLTWFDTTTTTVTAPSPDVMCQLGRHFVEVSAARRFTCVGVTHDEPSVVTKTKTTTTIIIMTREIEEDASERFTLPQLMEAEVLLNEAFRGRSNG